MMALPVLARELHHVVYLGKKCAMLDHLLLVVTGEGPVLLLVDYKTFKKCEAFAHFLLILKGQCHKIFYTSLNKKKLFLGLI